MSSWYINVAEEFSEYPIGRFRTDSKVSAERFRDDILIPALKKYDHVTVDLSGTIFYGSSFLEETFAGLLRHGFNKEEIAKRLTIKHDKLPSIVEEVNTYIDEKNNNHKST